MTAGGVRSGLGVLIARIRNKLARLLDMGGQVSAPARKTSRNASSAQRQVTPLIADDEKPAAKTRLLIFADGPGATQIISFDLPLRRLRQQGVVQLLMVSEADFDHLLPLEAEARVERIFADFRPTHVVVSRFGGLGASGIVKAVRNRGLSFTMHLDDNLFDVPEALGPGKYKKYSEPARRNRLRLLCERAEKVYVSTGPLKRQLEEMGIVRPISSGALYCALPTESVPYGAEGEPPVIGYMGTAGHVADLEMIVPAIDAVLAKRPDVRFVTFGSIKTPKALIQKYAGRVEAIGAAGSYLDFITQFQQMNWAVGLAPLQDTPFNACKANTKFVEYAVAGIPVVASDMNVYHQIADDGRGLLAGSADEWCAAILKLIDDRACGASMVTAAQTYLKDRYAMATLEQQVVAELGLKV